MYFVAYRTCQITCRISPHPTSPEPNQPFLKDVFRILGQAADKHEHLG